MSALRCRSAIFFCKLRLGIVRARTLHSRAASGDYNDLRYSTRSLMSAALRPRDFLVL